MSGRRPAVTALRAAIGLGLVAVLTARGVVDWGALLGLARNWPIVTLAVALLLLDLVVTASRLSLLLGAAGFHLSVGAATRLSLIGLFFNLFLPGGGGGDLVRIYYAVQGTPGRRAEVTTIMVLDRVCGAYAMVLFPVVVAPFVLPLLAGLPAVQALLAAGALTALAAPLLAWVLLRWGARLAAGGLARGRLATIAVRAFETAHAYTGRLVVIARAVGISLLAHGLSVTIMLLLAEAILTAGADARMALLIPVGYMVNTLPVTPGGLGVGEAALDGLFQLAGLSGGAELLLSWRLLSLVPAALGLAVYVQGRRRWVEARDGAP